MPNYFIFSFAPFKSQKVYHTDTVSIWYISSILAQDPLEDNDHKKLHRIDAPSASAVLKSALGFLMAASGVLKHLFRPSKLKCLLLSMPPEATMQRCLCLSLSGRRSSSHHLSNYKTPVRQKSTLPSPSPCLPVSLYELKKIN